jgi:hypothetical protein
MTNVFEQGLEAVEGYAERVLGGAEKEAVVIGKEVIDFMTPLMQQVQAKAMELGKQDLAAGLQVLKDAVATAVASGSAAILAGQNPVQAAEATFLTTAAGEGQVALNNAESAAIKAGVALAQQAAAQVETALAPAGG